MLLCLTDHSFMWWACAFSAFSFFIQFYVLFFIYFFNSFCQHWKFKVLWNLMQVVWAQYSKWTTSKPMLHKCAYKTGSQGSPGKGDCRNKLFLNQSEPHIVGEAVVRIAKQETQGLDSSYTQAQKQMVRRAFRDGLDWNKECVCITPPGSHLMLCSTCFSKHRMCLCSSCENKDVFKATQYVIHAQMRAMSDWWPSVGWLFTCVMKQYWRKEKRLKGKESINMQRT